MDRRSLLQLGCGALLAGGPPATALAARPFRVQDLVVSDLAGSLIDPEFSEVGLQMAWVDQIGNLWATQLNPQDGTWFPQSGQQALVDSNLARVGPLRQGCEWSFAKNGARLLYTGLINSVPWLFQARFLDGQWVTERLKGSANSGVWQASKDLNDLRPRAVFRHVTSSGARIAGWREIDNPRTNGLIPFPEASGVPIWTVNERSVVVADHDTNQIVKYDVDADEITFLTNDRFNKRWPRTFRDEFGLVLTTVLNSEEIGIYYEVNGRMEMVQRLRPPSEYPYVFAPKLWFHKGLPYLSFLMASEKNGGTQNSTGEAEVWITQVSAGKPFYRRVNDPAIKRIKDTEGVSYAREAYVYYAELLPDKRRLIHRCYTGL